MPVWAGSGESNASRRNRNDIAIVVNFPEKPIRIPDYRSFWYWWAHVFDWNGDNNLMISHTGVILVDSSTGQLNYYDFGRYDDRDDLMGPRPAFYGVVRSDRHVPELSLDLKARFVNGWIANLDTILIHLGAKKLFETYGKLQVAVVYNLDGDKMTGKARSYEEQGYIYYGAPTHLYCTSFVRKVIRAGGSPFGYFIFTGKQTVKHIRRNFRQAD